jgi:hypothetical protein
VRRQRGRFEAGLGQDRADGHGGPADPSAGVFALEQQDSGDQKGGGGEDEQLAAAEAVAVPGDRLGHRRVGGRGGPAGVGGEVTGVQIGVPGRRVWTMPTPTPMIAESMRLRSVRPGRDFSRPDRALNSSGEPPICSLQ